MQGDKVAIPVHGERAIKSILALGVRYMVIMLLIHMRD